MKKYILIVIVLLLTITASAQRVALHGNNGIQFFEGNKGFIDAYNTSENGDTIYLSGGGSIDTPFDVPAKIDKSLTVFGAGHYPDSTQVTGKTILNGNIHLDENADNFHIEGLRFNSLIFETNKSINNVVIKYCNFVQMDVRGDGTVQKSKNILLINNIIKSNLILKNAENVEVYNCILNNSVNDSDNNIFSNNIFYFNSSAAIFNRANHNFIQNCIIFQHRNGNAIAENTCSGNSFINNYTNAVTPNYGLFPVVEDNTLGLVNLTDFFVAFEGANFDYAHNYHLKTPANHLGKDGTQVGIYGGLHPFKESAVPSNPHLESGEISTISSDGKINVKVKASAQDK